MKCPKCGTELTREHLIAEDSIKCPNCGSVFQKRSSGQQPKQIVQPVGARQETSPVRASQNCPYCGSLLLGKDTKCPKCHYDQAYSDGGPEHQLWLQKQKEAKEEEARLDQQRLIEEQSKKRIKPNRVASLLKECAWIIYIGAFILGIIVAITGNNSFIGEYFRGLSAASMLSIWFSGFVVGTLVLSFGEIIELLHEINEKQDWFANEKK